MFRILIYGFIFYLLYRFITEFVLPVSKVSSQMRQKLEEMQRQQQEAVRRQQQAYARQDQAAASKKPTLNKDYIDYEEVK